MDIKVVTVKLLAKTYNLHMYYIIVRIAEDRSMEENKTRKHGVENAFVA